MPQDLRMYLDLLISRRPDQLKAGNSEVNPDALVGPLPAGITAPDLA